jgi:NADH-quinone oxidoreductase subunit N
VTLTDFRALLPLIVLALTTLGVLLAIAFHRRHGLAAGLAGAGMLLALATLPLAAGVAPRPVTALAAVDGYALLLMGLVLLGALVVTVLSYSTLEQQPGHREEHYVLLLLATLGCAVLLVSAHFASFFLGLEILSVALYGLLAYQRESVRSLEAGLKYLILAAASTAILLFGMALAYAGLGTMEFARLAGALAAADAADRLLVSVGLAMVLVGVGFKLALVPFHLWSPDIYEGAPLPVAAFVATVSKGAVFALALRLFAATELAGSRPLSVALTVLSVASMLVGNLLALQQTNVKRLLAYSSIAHLGYLLLALLAGRAAGLSAAALYLAAYFVTTLGAFGVIVALSSAEHEAAEVEDYRGLFWRRPWLAAVLSAMLFSLAGIPLTAGFIGKLTVLTAAVDASLWLLVLTLVVSSAIGLYYYLRLIVAMFLPAPPEAEGAPPRPAASRALGATLAALGAALLWLGVAPSPLLELIRAAVAGLF